MRAGDLREPPTTAFSVRWHFMPRVVTSVVFGKKLSFVRGRTLLMNGDSGLRKLTASRLQVVFGNRKKRSLL